MKFNAFTYRRSTLADLRDESDSERIDRLIDNEEDRGDKLRDSDVEKEMGLE